MYEVQETKQTYGLLQVKLEVRILMTALDSTIKIFVSASTEAMINISGCHN